ncbi:MAG: response regulator transcription factor [Bacteroides sp.]|nr:response regulator transcription factor [Bacteroides sp.]
MKREDNIQVLLVEDELTLAMIIKDTLEEESFVIHTAANGEEGLRLFFELRPHIVVADVMMPQMDGFTMVRRIRQADMQTPVLFLTARSAIRDVVEGFELGANDYLKKPFGMQELIVRIKSLLGRAFVREESEKQHLLEIGCYRLDPATQQLIFGGEQTELSHREAEILKKLCENRGKVVHTQDILLDLWGDDTFFNSRSLHVFITKIRHKLAKDPDIRILNVRGIGYKLIVHSTT